VQLCVATQVSSEQRHRGVLIDIGLRDCQIDAVELHLQVGAHGLRSHLAAKVQRAGIIDAGIERHINLLG
jgi:hypothetical protein